MISAFGVDHGVGDYEIGKGLSPRAVKRAVAGVAAAGALAGGGGAAAGRHAVVDGVGHMPKAGVSRTFTANPKLDPYCQNYYHVKPESAGFWQPKKYCSGK